MLFRSVARAAEYCKHLAENWRGASREGGSYAPVDLLPLVEEVIAVALVGRKPVRIIGRPSAPVLGSRFELMRVIQNLLKNAIESGATDVVVAFGDAEKEVMVTVSDNGPGMDAEQLNRALKGGYTSKRDGTGLGLSICRHIIASHGGSFVLNPAKNGGIEATVRLPQLVE